MSKQFWIVLTAIIVILGGIVFVTNHNKPSTSVSNSQPTNHVEGSSPTGAKLIEYGDYQCPVCGTFYSTVKQVAAKYSKTVVFQFRNLPLTSLHPNAFAAARAAEAAGLQGKYWEMHDMLYENQASWASVSDPQTIFDGYARALSLTASKFDTDYASDTVNNAINADLNTFAKTGDEMATPTFYLNGQRLSNVDLIDKTGQPSVDAFSKVIDTILAHKKYTPTPTPGS